MNTDACDLTLCHMDDLQKVSRQWSTVRCVTPAANDVFNPDDDLHPSDGLQHRSLGHPRTSTSLVISSNTQLGTLHSAASWVAFVLWLAEVLKERTDLGLTARSRVLLEKLTVPQLVKKFPAFCGTKRFITVFTTARTFSLSSANQVQPITHHNKSTHESNTERE